MLCDSLFTPADKMFSVPLFDNCEKSGEFLELFVITAVAATAFMIHYSIISPISAAGSGACLELNDSVYPNCSQALSSLVSSAWFPS